LNHRIVWDFRENQEWIDSLKKIRLDTSGMVDSQGIVSSPARRSAETRYSNAPNKFSFDWDVQIAIEIQRQHREVVKKSWNCLSVIFGENRKIQKLRRFRDWNQFRRNIWRD
jgi:hypothetical protein